MRKFKTSCRTQSVIVEIPHLAALLPPLLSGLPLHSAALLLLALTPSTSASECSGSPQSPSEIRELLFGPDSSYRPEDRPGIWRARQNSSATRHTPPPEDVWVQVQFTSLDEVDTRRGQYEVEVWIRVIWFDPRLVHNETCFHGSDTDHAFKGAHLPELWSPAIGVEELVDLELQHSNFWVNYDGRVWWTRTARLTLRCDMCFEFMPYDTQQCFMVFTSFKEGADEVSLHFGRPPGAGNAAPVLCDASAPPISTSEWSVVSVDAEMLEDDLRSALAQERLGVEIHLKRDPRFYESIVMPVAHLLVVVAWSSFFIARSAAPARVSMTVISFLSLNGMIFTVLSSLPRLGGGGVWLLRFLTVSLFFVAGSAIEYIIVNYLFRIEARVTAQYGEQQAAQRSARKATAPSPSSSPRVELTATAQRRLDRRMSTKAAHLVAKSEKSHRQNHAETPVAGSADAPGAAPAPSTSTTADTHHEPPSPPRLSIQREVSVSDVTWAALGPVDRLMFSRRGRMKLHDQHVDIFFRAAFPLAYVLALLVLYVQLGDPRGGIGCKDRENGDAVCSSPSG